MGSFPGSSVVTVHRLSFSVAYGVLLPPPGVKPSSPALQGRFLTTGPAGKVPVMLIFPCGLSSFGPDPQFPSLYPAFLWWSFSTYDIFFL